MAFDYTNLYPDTSGNGGFTKSWNYTSVADNIAACSAVGFFNIVSTRLGIGDNIVIAVVDAFDKTRTTLVDKATLFVSGISNGVVTTVNAAIYNSPAFTGIPTSPTAAPDTNTNQIATTAFVLAQAASVAPIVDGVATVGTSTRFARQDHIHPTDTTRAPLASPALTGTPTAPTATPGTNTTQLATTAYVDAADALKANTASPTFTGTPAAPTAVVDTNTTQLATTAMVLAQAASATPLVDGTAAVGTSTRFARGDHVHPTDTTRAPLASPTFTGTPAAPNATVDTNTGQIANTAFVIGQAATATPLIDGTAAVGTSTRYARGDHIHPTDTTRAALVSPAFTTPSLGVATATSINGATIDNLAWTTYTPTVGSIGGTITTYTATGRYKQIGKTIHVQASVTISNAGTGTSNLVIGLPFTAAGFIYVGGAYESVASGKSGAAFVAAGSSTLATRDYSGLTFIATGAVVTIGLTYEVP